VNYSFKIETLFEAGKFQSLKKPMDYGRSDPALRFHQTYLHSYSEDERMSYGVTWNNMRVSKY